MSCKFIDAIRLFVILFSSYFILTSPVIVESLTINLELSSACLYRSQDFKVSGPTFLFLHSSVIFLYIYSLKKIRYDCPLFCSISVHFKRIRGLKIVLDFYGLEFEVRCIFFTILFSGYILNK